MLGKGCVLLLWHSLGLLYYYFVHPKLDFRLVLNGTCSIIGTPPFQTFSKITVGGGGGQVYVFNYVIQKSPRAFWSQY